MKKNEYGFGIAGVIVVMIVVLLSAAVGWLVYYRQDSNQDDKTKSQLKQQETEPESNKNVELIAANIPEAWNVSMQETNRVDLDNKTNNCFISVISTSDTAESNSPSVDQYRQTVDAIKEKGYNVSVLTEDKFELTTNNGIKSLESLEIDVTGNDNPMSQSYGFITTEQRYTQVQASCTMRSDLVGAKQALTAIKINL